MTEESDTRPSFREYLMSMPGDDEFAEMLDHVRDCGCGLSHQERQFFSELCARAITDGSQLLQRESGNPGLLSEERFHALGGNEADKARVWTTDDDSR